MKRKTVAAIALAVAASLSHAADRFPILTPEQAKLVGENEAGMKPE